MKSFRNMTGTVGQSFGQHWLLLAITGGILFTFVSAGYGDGGSKCPDASCTPAPPGVNCNPKYERDDGCCPVWYCDNGQTAYGTGVSRSSGTSSTYSFSSSSGANPFSGGANPLSGMMNNLFGGLFG